MTLFFRTLRLGHWCKNLLVFIPLFLSGSEREAGAIRGAALGALIFCIAASVVYVFNDLCDRALDHAHPAKRNRPIAGGAVTPGQAKWLLLILFAFLAFSLLLLPSAAPGVIAYLINNLAYNWQLKKIPLVDLISVALGFVFRLEVGAAVTGVGIDARAILVTFFLALFGAALKRRAELLSVGVAYRLSLQRYSSGFLNFVSLFSALLALGAYLYFVSVSRPELAVSAIPMALALIRSYHLTQRCGTGEGPRDALVDWPIRLLAIGWLVLTQFSLHIPSAGVG